MVVAEILAGICVLAHVWVAVKARALMVVKERVTRHVLRLERVLTPVVMHVVTAPRDAK